MDARNVILVVNDPDRNIVRLTFVGDIGVDETQRHEKMIAETLAAAPRGFHLLTDLSKLNSMDLRCVPYIAKTMEAARSRGITRVVRIIPDPDKDIGFNIMSLFHLPRGLQIITCENEAEADRALK